MIRLVLALWLIGAPALAQDAVNLAGTVIRLQATTQPGAEAEVAFDNRNVNGPEHDGPFSLTWGGITLSGRFTWDARGSADSITVTPPPGYVCRPAACALEIEEDQTGTLWLFSIEGVGM